MFKIDHKKAQAATELAVFGAILIFLLGTIVRSAIGNSYTQDQNFQAMRMAMLSSWNGSVNGIATYNTASVLFLEDRLSPDPSKYGDVDRNPYVASGSGSFTYMLFYPLNSEADYLNSSPIQDQYINGQHFPFTEALYVKSATLYPPGSGGNPACQAPYPVDTYPLTPQQCQQNQCLRNQREWVGGNISESSFTGIVPVPVGSAITDSCLSAPTPGAERECQDKYNSATIFQELACKGWITTDPSWTSTDCSNPVGPSTSSPKFGTVSSLFTCAYSGYWDMALSCTMPPTFNADFQADFPPSAPSQGELSSIESKLQLAGHPFKLFYTVTPNSGAASFLTPPAPCTSSPCVNQALTSTMILPDANGVNYTNTDGLMAFDLSRMGYYTTAPPACANPPCESVLQQFPLTQSCLTNPNMRCYIAWKWAATYATSAANIGLNTTDGTFPQYDIDGRLKEVTIYTFALNSDNTPTVGYLDPQLGDIDSSWDVNSCGPKPGLQNDMQIYTFTEDGTYLLIHEGQLYNPESGQVVRSANKRDNVDLIQRTVQLSNNTGRFCTGASPPVRLKCVAGQCPPGVTDNNPVEVCVDESTADHGCNCFMGSTVNGPQNAQCGFTLAETCYDTSVNQIYIRSRLQDLRGRFWLTNASGQLKVQ